MTITDTTDTSVTLRGPTIDEPICPITQVIATTIDTTPAPIPTRDEVIAATVEKYGHKGITDRQAGDLYDYWVGVRDTGRENPADYQHLLMGQAKKRVHGVLSLVMPDDAVATPGSLHEMYERAILDPTRGEMALLHTRREHTDNCGTDIITQVT